MTTSSYSAVITVLIALIDNPLDLYNFQRVLAVIERKVWHIYGLINLEGKMEAKDVHEILKREQEVERKRRMSEPYGSDKSITDRHIQERKRRLSDLHEDLFKLFAINAVSFD